MSNVEILAKGQRTDISAKSSQTAGKQGFYFGLGWDMSGSNADLDLCVTLLNGNDVVDFVFYGHKAAPGVQLSDDNRTGEGDGDDEWAKITVAALPANVDSIVISVACYEGPDLSVAKNPLIRWCDGLSETSPELGNFPMDTAFSGDTLLKVVVLKKAGDKLILKAAGDFSSAGKGSDAIKAAKALKA